MFEKLVIVGVDMFTKFYKELTVLNQNNSEYMKGLMVDKMRDSLAQDIVFKNMETTQHDYYTKYRVNVIVATEDDFFKAVEEYARRNSCNIPVTLEEKEWMT